MTLPHAIAGIQILTLAAIALAAPSDTEDTTGIVELDRMVVTGERTGVIAYERLGSTTIDRPRDSRTIDGLLTSLAGVDVKRTSPAAGKGRAVTLRGFDESRYLILLDGRPLNGSGVMGGEYVDWSSLSAENVREVEVIRGPKSAEYGNSLGGVVNIVTTRPRGAPDKTTVNAAYGIVDPEHADDAWAHRTSRIGISHRTAVLDVATLDLFAGHARGEPYLRNNDYRFTTFGGVASLFLPFAIELGAGLRSSIQHRGFAIENHADEPHYDNRYPESDGSAGGGPGIAWRGIGFTTDSVLYHDYYFGDRSYWENIRTQLDFSLKKEFQKLLVTGRVYVNDQDRTEYFYAIGDTNRLVLERFTKPEDHTWGWNFKADQTLARRHTLTYGIEGSSLRYGQADIRSIDTAYFARRPDDGADETIRAADRYAIFVQSSLRFADRVELTPGARYDYYKGRARDSTVEQTPLQGISPNAGISVTAWPGGTIGLHAAYRYRFPTCPELYWYYAGYSFDGRTALSPERALQAELGLAQGRLTAGIFDLTLNVRGYYYLVNDYIRTIFGYRPSRLIYNIDKVSLAGIECEVSAAVAKRLHVWANYTYQTTRKSGDDYDSSMALSDRLPELPEHKANAGIEYRPRGGALIGLSMRLVGARDVIEGSLARGGASALTHVDPFVTFRLFGSYPVYAKNDVMATVKLALDNLFDTEYEEEPGIPMPGLTATGAVELTF